MSRAAADIAAALITLREETNEAVAQARQDEADWSRLRDAMNAITARYSQSSGMKVQEQLRPGQLVQIVNQTMTQKARLLGEQCLRDDNGDVTQETAVDALNAQIGWQHRSPTCTLPPVGADVLVRESTT